MRGGVAPNPHRDSENLDGIPEGNGLGAMPAPWQRGRNMSADNKQRLEPPGMLGTFMSRLLPRAPAHSHRSNSTEGYGLHAMSKMSEVEFDREHGLSMLDPRVSGRHSRNTHIRKSTWNSNSHIDGRNSFDAQNAELESGDAEYGAASADDDGRVQLHPFTLRFSADDLLERQFLLHHKRRVLSTNRSLGVAITIIIGFHLLLSQTMVPNSGYNSECDGSSEAGSSDAGASSDEMTIWQQIAAVAVCLLIVALVTRMSKIPAVHYNSVLLTLYLFGCLGVAGLFPVTYARSALDSDIFGVRIVVGIVAVPFCLRMRFAYTAVGGGVIWWLYFICSVGLGRYQNAFRNYNQLYFMAVGIVVTCIAQWHNELYMRKLFLLRKMQENENEALREQLNAMHISTAELGSIDFDSPVEKVLNFFAELEVMGQLPTHLAVAQLLLGGVLGLAALVDHLSLAREGIAVLLAHQHARLLGGDAATHLVKARPHDTRPHDIDALLELVVVGDEIAILKVKLDVVAEHLLHLGGAATRRRRRVTKRRQWRRRRRQGGAGL